jgi:hypothetical protein
MVHLIRASLIREQTGSFMDVDLRVVDSHYRAILDCDHEQAREWLSGQVESLYPGWSLMTFFFPEEESVSDDAQQ